MKVRAGQVYEFRAFGWDLIDRRANTPADGTLVRVIRPRFVESLEGRFLGLVNCSSLIPIRRQRAINQTSEETMSRKLLLTPEVFEQIQRDIAQGLTTEEIASRVGCSIATLRVTCSRAGISLRRMPYRAISLEAADRLQARAARVCTSAPALATLTHSTQSEGLLQCDSIKHSQPLRCSPPPPLPPWLTRLMMGRLKIT
jgi:hypothetical protein